MQIGAATTVAYAFLINHYLTKPFRDSTVNKSYTVSAICIVLTLVSAMLLKAHDCVNTSSSDAGDENSYQRWLFFFALTATNGYGAFYHLKTLVKIAIRLKASFGETRKLRDGKGEEEVQSRALTVGV